MKKCPCCGKQYSDDTSACPYDHYSLVPIGPTVSSSEAPGVAPNNFHHLSDAVRAASNRNMFIGGLWCVGGIAVTAITYTAASGGGTYFVAWGAIVFGAIQFIRGLAARSQGDDRRNWDSSARE